MAADLWLGRAARADVAVLDVGGRTARAVLRAEWLEAGSHPVEWDGRLESGARAPQGLYWLHVRIEGAAVARRIVLLD